MVEVNSKTVRFFKASMKNWNTGLRLKIKQEVRHSQPIQIGREIFQGDSRSPLRLCVAALIPSTKELNRADCGYLLHGRERKIIHLLYMDDMKVLGRRQDHLEKEIKIVKAISKHITINFL